MGFVHCVLVFVALQVSKADREGTCVSCATVYVLSCVSVASVKPDVINLL